MKKYLKIIVLVVIVGLFSNKNYVDNNKYFISTPNYLANSNINKDYLYLSDINYVNELTYVKPGYYLRLDKNSSSGLITVNIDGKKKSFIKGISAWATSNIVYDLQDYDYDYFTAYLGVDAKEISTYYNSGVTFKISTSNDGENWNDVLTTNTLKGFDNAYYAKVNIKGQRYLKLYAYENGNSWYSHWYDDAVYANAKLIKEDYEEKDKDIPYLKTVEEYDEIIKKEPTNNLMILQRQLVSKVGYDILKSLINYSEDYENIIKWLFNDEHILELYLLGGEPDGNYVSSFKILNELYHEYQSDLEGENKELYEKMMISLSLTHSASVGLWVTGAPENEFDPNGSRAIKRYEIYKYLYENDLLENKIFENISVEEMRFVMNNIIDDEEIIWLNSYTKETDKYNPYNFITYRFGYDYNKDDYYDYTKYKLWDEKYHLSKFKITNQKDHPKLWQVFEEGAVCGGISKTGSNIKGVYGIPSSVISQPGHAAYIYLTLDENGNKIWDLYNNVSGWAMSGKTEKLSVRMPNGWGSGDYAGTYPASYILLSQAALNNYEHYLLAEKKIMLANVYHGDFAKQEEIYNEALDIQNINFDVWLGLINLYEENDVSEDKYLELATRIANSLTYYPLPMHDLLVKLEKHFKSSTNIGKYTTLINEALTKASNATKENVLQPEPTKTVANYLLSNNDTELAKFSFSGENANEIVLSERFNDTEVIWEYNLTSSDEESDWHRTSGKKHLLTNEELNLIHPDTDIKVRIVGALDNVYNINIDKALMPNVYSNDLENKIYNLNNMMEWQEEDGNWINFSDEEPELTGNKIINIRVKSHDNKISSDIVKLEFTDNEDENNNYIPINRLSIDEVSSEELVREDNKALNALDGNTKTMWHTSWDGSDKEKYMIIKLDKKAFISSLEYVPRQEGLNGVVKKVQVAVSMDKENWDVVGQEDWNLDTTTKTISLNSDKPALYVKIIGLKTEGEFMSASMINLFEDVTKITAPIASINYNHSYLTNKDVTATLVNPSKNITITNNNGNNTYTFKENGEFTFNYVDDYGNSGTTIAKVDWIDKTVNANVDYEKVENSEVVKAILKSDEAITILNNDGLNTHLFTENGEFTFKYQDEVGNIGTTTAKVDWLKSEIQTREVVQNEQVNEDSDEKENSNKELNFEIKTDYVEQNNSSSNEEINTIDNNEGLTIEADNQNKEEQEETTTDKEQETEQNSEEEKNNINESNENKASVPLMPLIIGGSVAVLGIGIFACLKFRK